VIATGKECVAFRDYLAPLHILEEAFQAAGEKIEFRLGILNETDRYVEILYSEKPGNIMFIEGDSPTQAIKDVAGAVGL
jgi:hypothetical protein